MIETEALPTDWQCAFTDGEREAIADTTAANGGSGAGFRPHELLEAAFATCLSMSVRMAAAERGHRLDDVRTRVACDRSGERPTFAYAIEIVGVSGETAENLRDAVADCPVATTLTGDPAVERDPSLRE
ncbi:MAG: OsmC family protein [Halococcoides sp.]